MSETKHTPTPWHVVPETLGNIEDDNGLCVAQAQQTKPIRYAEDHAERLANAAFICQAVNSFDSLVKALEAAEGLLTKEMFSTSDGLVERCKEVAEQIRAALTAARKKV